MKKLLKWFFYLCLAGGISACLVVAVVYYRLAPELPDVESLRDVRLQVPLRVYSSDGKLISVFGEQRRIPASIDDIPDNLKNAFIAGEDARFYEHPGVDYQGLTRAAITLATTGEKSIGGSTITQMLARNYFLSLEKTFSRKTREIFLALKIEREFSKDEILELFLNKILLGHRAYGVGAAADVYYGKSLDQLTLAEAAMIAALPKAPSRINPITSPERALQRRNYVLSRMLELGYISPGEYDQAVNSEDAAYYHGASTEISAPYLAEMVRARVVDALGNEAYTGGYSVYTTVHSELQVAANQALRNGLEQYDRRHGYRGPEARADISAMNDQSALLDALGPFHSIAGLQPGIVTRVDESSAGVFLHDGRNIEIDLDAVSWARKFISRDRYGNKPKTVDAVLQAGDIIRLRELDDGQWKLGQPPDAEASLVSLDPQNGAIRALVGGYDFSRSKYNRVTQSLRQPGSSFKPFIYSAALERGYTTASLINDAPIVFEDDDLERTWKPQNFSEKFYGPTRLREAMVNSRNLVSIRLLQGVGLSFAREYISRFGFDPSILPANLSLALGSASVPAIDMARGYAVFANGGYLVNPFFIDRIEGPDQSILFEAKPARVCQDCRIEEVSGPVMAESDPVDEPEYRPLAVTDDAGESGDDQIKLNETKDPLIAPQVISEQNAYLVRSMMKDVIRRGTGKKAMELGRDDLAGKTGTTNDQRDAWFSGYNEALVTTVWVGFDSHEPLGRSEVGGRAALPIWIEFMGKALADVPEVPATLPSGLVQARINPESGLIAALDNPGGIMELFQTGRLPDIEISTEGARDDATTEQDPYDIY